MPKKIHKFTKSGGKPSRSCSEEQIEKLLLRYNKPLSADAVISAVHVKGQERANVLLLLKKMEKSGKITRNKKGKYVLTSKGGKKGHMLSLSKGFGFARLDDTGDDCFIPGRFLKDALPGDEVMIRLGAPDERGLQGAIMEVTYREERLFSGRLLPKEGGKDSRYFVAPDSGIRYMLPVKKSSLTGCEAGDKVRFAVQWREEDLQAVIVTSYGKADSAKVCADAIVDNAGIPSIFPAAVLEEAGNLQQHGIHELDMDGREDLRQWTIFTIDGADAKDLDDAVSLEHTAEGWCLGVHIADVSHYVTKDSPLDEEALKRGTSVYFADRVIPMLPEALSNDLCSLHPETDKLAFSALLSFSEDFQYKSCRLVKSVIRSKIRGVYSEINDIFQGTATEDVQQKYRPVEETINDMRRLAVKLRGDSAARGTMDLISTESQFLLDEKGAPAAVFARVTGEAEGTIEQFMIAANVAVATFAREKKLPFIYRVHEHPNPEKLAVLMETVEQLGLKTTLKTQELPQTALRELMEEVRDTPYARLISDRLLRSMAKAQYSPNPLGHYGLVLADYCHFTSPIRRYPDLAIHRILTDYLAHTTMANLYKKYDVFVKSAADQSTACEIRAMTAERECEACYKAEYMASYLGKNFTGIISAISDFGVYVELSNTVEGMIRLENLSEAALRYDGVAGIVNEQGKPLYRIGDTIEIQVAACDVSTGRITFIPAIPVL